MELFDNYRTAFNKLLAIRNKKRFCEKVRDMRNLLSHTDYIQDSHVKYTADLFHLTERLRVIVTCILLCEIGFEQKKVREMVYLYSGFTRFLRAKPKILGSKRK
jgi:hypothetical protein